MYLHYKAVLYVFTTQETHHRVLVYGGNIFRNALSRHSAFKRNVCNGVDLRFRYGRVKVNAVVEAVIRRAATEKCKILYTLVKHIEKLFKRIYLRSSNA